MRVLVCGGREYSDYLLLQRTLDGLHRVIPFAAVIEGDARGADRMAGTWALENNVPVLKFPADWETYGKSAGPIRNRQMLDDGKPDLVVAFPGGRGTKNMTSQARARRINIIEV